MSRAGEEYYFQEGCYILEYHNDPGDPAASIARARVPRGGHTRRHWLANTTERYLILQGQGDVVIDDGSPRSVSPADVVVVPPDTAQSIRNTGADDLVFLAICTPRFELGNYND